MHPSNDAEILACIDGSTVSTAVCDAATWASQRLNTPMKLLHVLEKSEYPIHGDLSGNIGLGSREHLLEELVKLDEQRGKLALENGRHMLEASQQRARENGAATITLQQRHGSLAETLVELEETTGLLVIGRQGKEHDNIAHAIGSHLENVIRRIHRPILVAVEDFIRPSCFMIAFDGSPTTQKALSFVADNPLLSGLPCHLVNVCDDTNHKDSEHKRELLSSASARLKEMGYEVETAALEGDVQTALEGYQKDKHIDFMVMGAYGHSRIRQFLVGSNTTKVMSLSDIPLLLLR